MIDLTATSTAIDAFHEVYDSEDDYQRYEDDPCDDFRHKKKEKRKQIRKNFKSWDIDKPRLLKLQKLALMTLPQRTIDVLSKLIINHQITEIGGIAQKRKNCITVKAKVNLENGIYRNMKCNDVILKIFTRKNFTKSDVVAAEKFTLTLYNLEMQQKPLRGYYNNYYEMNLGRENLMIIRIDSIIIIKTVGDGKPLSTLAEMITKNPHKRLIYLGEVLRLLRHVSLNNSGFLHKITPLENILYCNEQWLIKFEQGILGRNQTFNDSLKIFACNFLSLLRLFNRYFIKSDLKTVWHNIFNGSRRNTMEFAVCQIAESKGW